MFTMIGKFGTGFIFRRHIGFYFTGKRVEHPNCGNEDNNSCDNKTVDFHVLPFNQRIVWNKCKNAVQSSLNLRNVAATDFHRLTLIITTNYKFLKRDT